MNRLFVWTKDNTPEDGIELRRKGISGSDVGSICGVNRWKSSVEVYLEKLNEAPTKENNETMEIGRKMKRFVAREFSERTGFKLMHRNAVLVHPNYLYMHANIDRWIMGQECGLLCKNTGEYMREEWKDKVPPVVELQCLHFMAITGSLYWWVAVLIGGNKLQITRIERDESKIIDLIEAERNFWEQHILKRVPPQFDGHTGSTELLKRMYPEGEKTEPLRLSVEALELVTLYTQADKEEKAADIKKSAAENRLKAMLGSNQSGIIGPYKVEWKNIYRDNEVAHRRFQIKMV